MGKTERRSHKRILVPNSCMICRDVPSGRINVSTICDLTEYGMGFYTRQPISVGAEINFDFTLPKKKGMKVNGVGKVVWVAPLRDVFGDTLTRCGIKFKNLPSGSVAAIRTYIQAQQGKA